MNNYHPIFRSPITPIPHPPSHLSQLSLADLTGLPIILIQGETGDILKQHFAQVPAKPGEIIEVEGGLLARLTPTEFYLFGLSAAAKLPSAAKLDNSLAQAQRFAQATEFTHGKAILRLAGAAAGELLSKICGLDFHSSFFQNMRVAQSSAAKIKTLIARCDERAALTYYLHVNRPFGQYFWDVVWDAGQEFGITAADQSQRPPNEF